VPCPRCNLLLPLPLLLLLLLLPLLLLLLLLLLSCTLAWSLSLAFSLSVLEGVVLAACLGSTKCRQVVCAPLALLTGLST
jgi:hypothetical protein